jgi:hypothetical protein
MLLLQLLEGLPFLLLLSPLLFPEVFLLLLEPLILLFCFSLHFHPLEALHLRLPIDLLPNTLMLHFSPLLLLSLPLLSLLPLLGIWVTLLDCNIISNEIIVARLSIRVLEHLIGLLYENELLIFVTLLLQLSHALSCLTVELNIRVVL